MSENEKVVGRPIGNLLYTNESSDSLEKAKGELRVPDPEEKKVVAILNAKVGGSDESQSD